MLNEGKNKPILIGAIILVVIVVIITAVNVLMTDHRDNMTSVPENKFIFENSVIELEKQYLWNSKNERAELSFNKDDVFHISDDFSISLTNQEEEKLNTEIIKGDTTEVEDDVYLTNYKVRFSMPKDTWYIQGVIQKGNISYSFMIDYRDFTKANIK